MAVRHGPGPAYSEIRSQASPIAIALVAAGLEFGIESLASALKKGAEYYEVKSHIDRPTIFGTLGDNTLLSRRSTMSRADVFAVVRVASVDPAVASTLTPIPPKKGKNLGEYWDTLSGSRIESVVKDMSKSLKLSDQAAAPWSRTNERIDQAMDLVKRAVYDRAPEVDTGKDVVVLSFAAVMDCHRPVVDGDSTGSDQGYQVSLRCYTYPLQMNRKGRRATSQEGVKAIFSLTVEAPDGHKNGHPLEYAHSAAFQVKADFDNNPAPWVVGTRRTGWVARSRRVGAAPPTTLVNVRAQLLETSSMKKTLESMGKYVGKVKLKPEDIGIE